MKQEGVWHRKSSVNPGPCCEAGRCLVQEKAFYLLLQVLFTTEEWEQILAEAWKRVLGVNRRPTTQPHLVDKGFPLLRPNWDFE